MRKHRFRIWNKSISSIFPAILCVRIIYRCLAAEWEFVMHIKSAVDLRYEALVFSAIAFMTMGALYLISSMDFSLQMATIGGVCVVIASALLLWFLFGSYYELSAEYLYCKCGPFSEVIRYDDVVSLRLCKNTSSYLALSSKRIEIRWYDDGFITESMISPKNRKIFLAHLKAQCSYLEDAA